MPLFAAALKMLLFNPTSLYLLLSVLLMKSFSYGLSVRKTQKMITLRQTLSKMTGISGECSRLFIRHPSTPAMTPSYPDIGRLRRSIE